MCCDGPAGLPEAARGDLARLHGPHLRGPPDPRHPCGSSPTGTARGSPPPCARACTAPDEEAARRAPGAFRQSDPGRKYPQTAAGAGEGLGEEHRLPGLPPGPAPGHLCTTNAIESLNHRAARSAENRGHFPSDEAAARTAVAGGSATSRTAGPRSAPRRRTRPPTRAGPRADSSRDRSPPTGSRPWPSSPPPTPTESTPTSDRTRLHRNIDRLPPAGVGGGAGRTRLHRNIDRLRTIGADRARGGSPGRRPPGGRRCHSMTAPAHRVGDLRDRPPAQDPRRWWTPEWWRISRAVIPPAYKPMIIASSPSILRWPMALPGAALSEPARSRGTTGLEGAHLGVDGLGRGPAQGRLPRADVVGSPFS